MKKELYPAHINRSDEVQSVRDHCLNTAEIAKITLSGIGLQNTAYLAGVLHDCGKCSDLFSDYIKAAHNGEKVKKGSVIHTFAGCSEILNHYHDTRENVSADNYINKITSEILSYSIGAHHGLFDLFNEETENGFDHRLNKQTEYDRKTAEHFYDEVISRHEVNLLFREATKEIDPLIGQISELAAKNDEICFYLGLLCRLLTSAIIDADRSDTAAFMDKTTVLPIKTNRAFWKSRKERLEAYLKTFPCKTTIQKARKELSDICAGFASTPGGIYRLNIPTGGGKTLSGLRYAVTYAEIHEKQRIIYLAPLISILEQNAEEIKQALGEDIVLEHHSDLLRDENETEFSLRQYLEETWEHPVIATTLVQFLNVLFSAKSSCVRRFHSLADSVIIIDEVQSVPSKLLSLFNLAVNFLHSVCRADILLCSATQPTLEELPHKIAIAEKEMIPSDQYLYYYNIFKRNTIYYSGDKKLDEIPSFVNERFSEQKSLLVICNKKEQAEYIYNTAAEKHEHCFHLSAGMCMEHRKDVLNSIVRLLDAGEKVLCISTQVIEAGVDISFGAVIRLLTGMDSIVQSAGRCNRHGELGKDAPVYVLHCIDENLQKLKDIANAKRAATELITEFTKNSSFFGDDLSSQKAVSYYYSRLFATYPPNHFDYSVNSSLSLYDLLAENKAYSENIRASCFFNRQAFRKAGELFKVFDDETESVFVSYGSSEDTLQELIFLFDHGEYALFRKKLREAKRFFVSVYKYQMKKLIDKNAVRYECGSLITVLDNRYYQETGITNKPKGGQ